MSIFDKPIEKMNVPSKTVGQREDGSWYWLDETYGEGDDVKHATREDAVAAQNRYCDWLMGENPEAEVER